METKTYILQYEGADGPVIREEHIILDLEGGLKIFDFDLNIIEKNSEMYNYLKDMYYQGGDIYVEDYLPTKYYYTGYHMEETDVNGMKIKGIKEIKIEKPVNDKLHPEVYFGFRMFIVKRKHQIVHTFRGIHDSYNINMVTLIKANH